MANHLNKDSPTDDSIERWLEDDGCPFLQICNSIDGKVLVRYCTVFSFIILLYCESYECIYISPICDVLTHY